MNANKMQHGGIGGIRELRLAVATLGRCREDFNQQFSARQLLIICDTMRRSGWDVYPDQYEEPELEAALAGDAEKLGELLERRYA